MHLQHILDMLSWLNTIFLLTIETMVLCSVVSPYGASHPLLRLGPALRVRPRRRRLPRRLLPAVTAARVGVDGTAASSPAGCGAPGEHHERGSHHVGGISRRVAEVDRVSVVVLVVVMLLLLIEPREEPVIPDARLVDL